MEEIITNVEQEVVSPDIETVDSQIVEETSDQPLETTSQSTKDNSKEFNFAELRKSNAELKREVETLRKQQIEKDDYYAKRAIEQGRPDIKSEADYQKAVRLNNLSEQYKETNDPLILAEILKETMPQATQQVQQSPIDNGLDKEVEEFNKEFKGTLKSIDDILTLPNSNEIIGYMQNNGLPLNKAYALANPDKIQAASKQAAINQARGHSHIQANNNGGNVDTTIVTAGEIQNWKRWFPGKTDEQCRKEIAANKKLTSD